MILQTERLLLREMTQEDFPALCRILQDEQTMYAYEGAFSDSEAQVWLDRQLERYRQLGFGLWAVILKQTGEMIAGICFIKSNSSCLSYPYTNPPHPFCQAIL